MGVPDWIFTLLAVASGTSHTGDNGQVFRMLKAARAIRVLRLLRLAKVRKMFEMIYDTIDSEYIFIIVNLFKLLCIILVLNHVIACLWYFVGRLGRQLGYAHNWLEHSGYTPVWEADLSWK